MSRNAIVVVAGLIVVGCVVAMLPAQDSSRRRTSAYRAAVQEATSSGASAPGESLERLPDPAAESQFAMPPDMAAEGPAPTAPPGIQNPYAAQAAPGEAPAFAPTPDNPTPYQPPEDPTVPQGLPSTDAPAPMQSTEAEASASDAPGPAPTTIQPASPSAVSAPAAAPPVGPPTSSAAIPAGDENLPPIVDRSSAGQIRSVLKRPQTAVIGEAKPPVTTPPSLPRPSASATARRATTPDVPLPSATSTSRSPRAIAAAESGSIRDLSMSARSPALRVDVVGPQGITVGKPADYVVSLVNESDAPALDVQVRLALPAWVAISGCQPTGGEAMMQGDSQGTAQLVWTVPKVAPRANEQLRLQLVTREGDAFELGVDWTCRPAAARAQVVVKEPQLDISLAGPGDMIFGEEKVFTLSVSNPGTGDAERVVVNISTGDGRTQPIEVGNLAPGTKKDVPLQVVANQAGEMGLKATATAEGGLSAEATGKVLVRKAELSLAVEGPPLKFAGTEAVYLVTVTNTGNALADNVSLSLALPTGAKYLSGIDGAAPTAGGPKWKVSSLPPGSERQYEVHVQLHAAGLNRLVVQANAAAAGTASSQAETEVEAVSDLKLVINDPAGPLPTGEQAIYEVQVMNRGSQAAEQVRIVVQFSEGIEPIAFDGCEARIVPGQVLCRPLRALGAGEQVTLRIRAKSQTAGTHQFRVEVTEAAADTRLVSEGTTRFFSETGRLAPAASTAKRPTLLPSPAAPGTIQR